MFQKLFEDFQGAIEEERKPLLLVTIQAAIEEKNHIVEENTREESSTILRKLKENLLQKIQEIALPEKDEQELTEHIRERKPKTMTRGFITSDGMACGARELFLKKLMRDIG